METIPKAYEGTDTWSYGSCYCYHFPVTLYGKGSITPAINSCCIWLQVFSSIDTHAISHFSHAIIPNCNSYPCHSHIQIDWINKYIVLITVNMMYGGRPLRVTREGLKSIGIDLFRKNEIPGFHCYDNVTTTPLNPLVTMQIGCISDMKYIECIVSELQPLKISPLDYSNGGTSTVEKVQICSMGGHN